MHQPTDEPADIEDDSPLPVSLHRVFASLALMASMPGREIEAIALAKQCIDHIFDCAVQAGMITVVDVDAEAPPKERFN